MFRIEVRNVSLLGQEVEIIQRGLLENRIKNQYREELFLGGDSYLFKREEEDIILFYQNLFLDFSRLVNGGGLVFGLLDVYVFFF